MRSFSHVPLLESFKILSLASRSSLEAKRKKRMLISTRKTGHSIKMTLPPSILLDVKLVTSLQPVNVVRCLRFISGTLTPWHPWLTSVLGPKLRVVLLFRSVLARSTSLLLTRVMTTSCTSTISTDKRWSCSSLPDLTPFNKSNGPKNQEISNLLQSPLVLFNSGTQLTLAKSYTEMVPSVESSHKPGLTLHPSMRMAFAIPVEPTVVSIFGTKSKSSNSWLKHTLANALKSNATRESLHP